MTTEYLRCWAEIDTDALLGNFEAIRRAVPLEKKLMAVIKADGYGHGAVSVARLLEGKADFFGVAMLDEAIELRQAGIEAPILVLGYTQPELFHVAVKYDVRLSLYHTRDVDVLDRAARELGKNAYVHIALDTGMGRIGYDDTQASASEIAQLMGLRNVTVEGIYSHFANADSEDKTHAVSQLDRFSSFLEKLERLGVSIPISHLYNSAATVEFSPDFDMMREGIILYGLRPSNAVDVGKLGAVQPVMSLRAKIGHVKTLPPGSTVSYGCTFVADRHTVVATVCAGYADGVPRVLSNKGDLLVNGQRARIIGRVCMDQFMVDVTDIPNVSVGDTVTVFGRDNGNEISADEVAALSDTIGYEIVCGIAKRVPRAYVSGGEIVEISYGIPHEER